MKKIGIFAAFALGLMTNANAAQYKFSISSPDMTKLSQAKNCLDYLVCGQTATSLNIDDKRFHVWIELVNDQRARSILNQCNFKKHGVTVIVLNEDTGFQLNSDLIKAQSDLFARLPDIYLPALSDSQKTKLDQNLTELINKGQKIAAVNLIIQRFGFKTRGYQISEDPSLDRTAVTDHDSKTVRISPSYFTNTCELIGAVRHEAEHIAQNARADLCAARGVTVSLDDHVMRERSAYLNDIANIRNFCGNEQYIQEISNNSWAKITQDYFL